MQFTYKERRKKRHERIRKRIFGTQERPRLCVFRSGQHLYAQLIDDYSQRTLFVFSTLDKKFQSLHIKGATVEGARRLGETFASELAAKGFKKIVFDRGGYQYHGRVKALAEALREKGIDF